MTPKLTSNGRELLQKVLAGSTSMKFTKVEFGSGDYQEPLSATGLANKIIDAYFTDEASIGEKGTEIEGYVTLNTSFINNTVESGFHITEVGFYVADDEGSEILYAIGYEDSSKADYVPGMDERIFEYQLEALIFIGDTENVTAAISESLSTVTQADFKAHVEDKNNPHEVTKAQVGLSDVPNVSTNNQLPTFEDFKDLVNLDSGKDVMSVLFGKISKAIRTLISHISDKKNPHEVTAEQVKAAAIKHNHSATDINKGVLSAQRGGTGVEYPTKGSVIVGNDKESMKELVGEGAFFSKEKGTFPEYGTLPVRFGGTGLTNGAEFASPESLSEGSYGCYGSVVLPGGLLVQWGRLKSGNRKVSVNFLKKFANTQYALIFTTSAGGVDDILLPAMPDWRVPDKNTDSFTMARASSAATQVADWIAFGKAAE